MNDRIAEIEAKLDDLNRRAWKALGQPFAANNKDDGWLAWPGAGEYWELHREYERLQAALTQGTIVAPTERAK